MTVDAAAQRHLGHVARGGALGLVGAVVSAVAGFLLVVAVTRGLDPDEAGVFFAATATFLMVAALASLGTETGLARFVLRLEAEGRADAIRRLLTSAAVTVLAVSVGAGLVLVAFAGPISSTLGWDDTAPSIPVLFALALPLAAITDFALAGTRAVGRMRPTVLVDRFLRSGGQAALVALALALGGGLASVTGFWLAPYAVTALLAVFVLRRLWHQVASRAAAAGPAAGEGAGEGAGKERTEAARPVVREFWRFTWPRGLTRLSQIGIQKADIVLVAALLSPRDAAVYTAATRFVALGQFATQALQQVLQPRFTAILVHEDRATLQEVYRVATAWNVLLTWPIYLVIGCAPLAYLGIFGERYATMPGAAPVVVAMMLAMLLAVASGPVDTLLLMAGRSGRSLANATAALTVDVALCLILLPRIGILGAALAWGAAVLTRCGLAYWQVRGELRVVPTGRPFATAVAASVATIGVPMTAASLLGLRHLAAWLLLGLALGVVYLGVLWLLRAPLRLDVLVAALTRRTNQPGPRTRTEHPGGSMRVRTVSGALRTRLPAPAVSAARTAALGWGRTTAPRRMVPAFVIVGAQRSGTTTLFRLLSDHPNVIRPTLSKGTGYFDDEYHRGPRWYRAHFPLRQPGHADDRVTFECSGYYMFHPHAPFRMARDLPDVRVVAMLRDPVERAYSAHQHELARGFETLPFEAAVRLESARTAVATRRIEEDQSYVSFAHRHHAYLARGEYDVQLARLFEAFGRERVFVVEADAFFADPVTEFGRLQEWLDLPVWVPDEVPRWNARPRSPMDPACHEELREHFAPHDERLATMLGHTPAWRTAEVAR